MPFATSFKSGLRRAVEVARFARHGKADYGVCPICEGPTFFLRTGDWLRDQYLCCRCRSIPRFRGLIHVLERTYPTWRHLIIHESSPDGAGSMKIAREAAFYSPSQYFPDVPLGKSKNGVRCENLERLTFADKSFDLFITQDVFEHVLNPGPAFREIERVLKPGGAHVFTVPVFAGRPTLVRAIERDGQIEHLEPPDYHGNPIDEKGSLVIREWGDDLIEFIDSQTSLTTETFALNDVHRGLVAEFLQVYVSRKRVEPRT
ncbi:MAG: class I SAM-dependent methyltransferase [Capsulimonadaceae bacterium]